jgi:hypothetical protein
MSYAVSPESLPRTLYPGAHLKTPRRGFVHHGMYVGGGRVIHYAGFDKRLRRHPVEEVSVSEFARGHRIALQPRATVRFDAATAIARARSRLGEDRYRLWSNNCEHFIEWSLNGVNRSAQVEAHRQRLLAPFSWLRPLAVLRRALLAVRAARPGAALA